jgi:hypothetical protein
MTLRKRLERLEAKTWANIPSNLPTIVINIVSHDDDGVILSLPAFAKVPTGIGWHELTRDEDETGAAFMGRVRQCEARQST